MNKIERFTPLAGRILLSAIFLMSGFSKIGGFERTSGFMESKGMPMVSLLLVGAILLEVLGGLSVLVGLKARIGAAALILFLIPATLIFHDFWNLEGMEHNMQRVMFLKNLAIVGGLLLVIGLGAGPLSVDNRKTTTAGA